ncbi:MAG: MFS transporter [Acidobacteriota bacterium]|nr:MAG: MFS transporter [Acidobacteriota bacterium]
MGQVVSEIGDHFNNIAVFGLVLAQTHSGLVVTGVMLARGVSAVLAGPVAGVLLDRMNRKQIMITSDLVRALIAIGFIFTVDSPKTWLMYLLSSLLMFASPFFTSGRSAILPSIVRGEELHSANALSQTTQWVTLTLGALSAGGAVAHFGYKGAFLVNAASFIFSAWSISRLDLPPRAPRKIPEPLTETRVVRPWTEYVDGLRYMRSNPLVLGIALVGVGWATGGGAAQILFSLFGEIVFERGASGIGTIWGFAGFGLLVGGTLAYWLGTRLSFDAYKWAIVVCYLVHGGAYVFFSQAESFAWALVFIAVSRAGVGVSSVLNFTQLLRRVPDELRGRVFSTLESMVWSTMIFSMALTGLASEYYSPRVIGVVSGILSSTTALFWAWANLTGRLPRSERAGIDIEEVEIHGEPRFSG